MGAQSLQATVAKRLEATRANTLDLRRYRSYSLEAILARVQRPYSLEAIRTKTLREGTVRNRDALRARHFGDHEELLDADAVAVDLLGTSADRSCIEGPHLTLFFT